MKYNYIDNQYLLEQFVSFVNDNRLSKISLDFEGESNLHRYGIHICLIQVEANGQIFLIDTMKKMDFSGLKNIFENPEIEKIIFAAEFDIKLIKHTLKINIKNIFDIQIAAKLLNYENISLKDVIESILEVTIPKSKKKQRANWSKRPIDEKLLEYASEDVAYLEKLYDKIKKQLVQENKMEHFIQQCSNLESLEFDAKKKSYRQIKGAGDLLKEEQKILKEIFNLREKFAKKIDKPVFYILPDSDLLVLAKNYPNSKEKWEHLIKKKKNNFKFLDLCKNRLSNYK